MIKCRPAEFQVLLLSARMKLTEAEVSQLRKLVDGPLDWTRLFSLAQRHSLLSILYWQLHRHCEDHVPSSIIEKLHRHFRSNLLRNQIMTRELLRLVQLFEQKGIPLIPYKGPVLSQFVYQNVGFREFSDLDILIKKHDVRAAKKLLVSNGYKESFNLTPAQEAAYLNSNGQFIFEEQQHKIFLELHWRFLPARFRFPIDPDIVWNDLMPVALDGRGVLSLSPDNLLLVLCVHNSKHLWEKMLWIGDVAELLRMIAGKIDWGQFWVRAEKLASLRKVYLGIYLASTLLNAPIPGEVTQLLERQSSVKRAAERITAQLWAENDSLPRSSRALLNLKMADHVSDALRFMYRRALTPTLDDWSAISLPDSLYPLYYLVHFARSTTKYVAALATSFTSKHPTDPAGHL